MYFFGAEQILQAKIWNSPGDLVFGRCNNLQNWNYIGSVHF